MTPTLDTLIGQMIIAQYGDISALIELALKAPFKSFSELGWLVFDKLDRKLQFVTTHYDA